MGLAGPSPPCSPQIFIFIFIFLLFFKIKKREWGSGSPEGRGAVPPGPQCPRRLRSPPPPPLSGSRAAAHVVPCQIPGGSGGHVSGRLQLRRPA